MLSVGANALGFGSRLSNNDSHQVFQELVQEHHVTLCNRTSSTGTGHHRAFEFILDRAPVSNMLRKKKANTGNRRCLLK